MLQGPITNQGTTLNTQFCDNDHYIIKLWNHIKQPIMLQGPVTNQGTTLNTQLCDNDHDNIKLRNHIKQPVVLQGPITTTPIPQPSTIESHYHTPICITGYDQQTDIQLGHKCQTIKLTAYLGIREVFMKKCRQPGQEDIETIVGAIVGHKQCPGKNNNKNTNKKMATDPHSSTP